MLNTLGLFAARRHRLVLSLAAVLIVALTAVGIGVFSKLQSGGQVDPAAASSQAEALVSSHFGGQQGLVVLVSARTGTVSAPAVVAVGKKVTAALDANPNVGNVTSYWQTRSPALRSRDGRAALILAHVKGSDNLVVTRTKALMPKLSTIGGNAASVRTGGTSAANSETTTQVGKDLLLVSVVAVPITIVLLYLTFGNLIAALLPLAVAVLAIMGTFTELSILTGFTSVSSYAVDLTIALGIGLSIDYSLLLINRYREEVSGGLDSEAAVGQAVATAGRTILFSALTVAVALTALLVFPLYFLRSFGYAGIAVVFFAVLGTLFITPALLGAYGARTTRRARQGARTAVHAGESPFYRRLATFVTARPVTSAVPVVVLLVLLGSPFLHVRFATPDDRVLPTSASAHQVGDALRTQFSADASSTVLAVATGASTHQAEAAYAQRLSNLAGVSSVQGPTGTYRGGRHGTTATHTALYTHGDVVYWQIQNQLLPSSSSGQRLVSQVRALPSPAGQRVQVGGTAANIIDQKASISAELPLAGLIIVLSTFVILFLFTGSVLIPLKAVLLNAVTLVAVLGLMVWIFQSGHFSGLLSFTPTATSTTIPPLLFVIAFGLSMDYEVFLISRIKELHDAGESNTQAIIGGLARTGRIVSTAAALLAVTFFAFGLSKISFIQFFGIGTGIAILIDATIVRGVLVPVVMGLAGERIWWAPRPLRRLHARIGFSENPVPQA